MKGERQRGNGQRDQRADVRFVDPERAGLSGVGADQEVAEGTYGHGDELEAPSPYDVWRDVPRSDDDRTGEATYFDRPVLKEPVWIWTVPAYFYTGGAAGAAAVLGAVTQNRSGLEDLTQRCRWIATVGTISGVGFLVADLGRPERFLNMLRVFRPTSPMSVGSWLLGATSGAATVSALGGRRGGVAGVLADLAGLGGAVFGGPLAGYTAVLVSNTAVPAWQGARRTLPWLFAGSGVVGAASLLSLMDLDEEEASVVRAFHLAGALWELAAGEAVEREVGRVERAARPYHDGASGTMWKAAKVATASSLVLAALPGPGRGRRFLAGLLGTAGSILLRFAVFNAGKRSARDPRATFHQQREGLGAAEVTGQGAVVGSGSRRATARPLP